jgi:hypothetical protein
VVAFVLVGCGGSTKTVAPVQTGTLITFIGDTPACDILAFRPGVTKISMTPQGAGAEVAVLLGTPAFAPSIKVNLAGLRDAATVLNIASVAAGTYDAITLTFQLPTVVVYDNTQVAPNPPLRKLSVTLNPTAPKIPMQSPLVINPPVTDPTTKAQTQQVSALMVDLNFLQSIGPIAAGQTTVTVAPVLTATPLTGSTELATFEGLRGFVQRVDTVSSNTAITNVVGDFQMQLLEGSSGAPSILVNLTTATTTPGLPETTVGCPSGALQCPDLLHLPTGEFVEVDGYLDTKGNFVANDVNVQDRENADQNKLAFIGYVLSFNPDGSINFAVHEEEPNPNVASPPLDTALVVTLPPPPYQFSSPATNFANPQLTFGPQNLVPGQELIVHGTYTLHTATPPALPPPTTVAADKIDLPLQTAQGNFASRVQAGSDDKTGAFMLATCATLLQGTPIMVVTNSQTSFVNVAGLAELAPQPTLLVKGLPFFQPTATTVNAGNGVTVAVPAGTLVILAKQVHQLT